MTMAQTRTPYDPRTAIVILSLYRKVSDVCQSTGDLDPLEYAILLAASEYENGIDTRMLKNMLTFDPQSINYVDLLESKELIERKRSSTDRRAFAHAATRKGRDRIALVDGAIARTLIASTPRVTEERFEHLVEAMHKAVLSDKGVDRIATLFPATALLGLCALRNCIINESSVAGMSTTAFAILQTLSLYDKHMTAEDIAAKLGVPAVIITVFIERMEERHWLRVDPFLSLTETGKQKGIAVAERLAQRIPQLQEHATDAQRKTFEHVAETCLYLFG